MWCYSAQPSAMCLQATTKCITMSRMCSKYRQTHIHTFRKKIK